MPYYQRSWNEAFGDQAPKQAKNVRTVPVNATQEEPAKAPPQAEVKADKTKVASLRAKLNQAVQELQVVKATEPVKNSPNYLNYDVRKDQVIFSGTHSEIRGCTNAQYGNCILSCREFYPSCLIKPDTDLYLKLIRYIGSKCPFIIQTMDIFLDQNRHIFVFQEYANRGNAYDYLRGGSEIEEPEMRKWAQSIYKALDFLGDIGVSHRAVDPKHILVQCNEANGETQVKLSGFRDAVLYWDPATHDIIDQPCKPITLMKQVYFNAPESFGTEGEFFNPLEADVWSFGASMFHTVSRMHPFNIKAPEKNLEAEIQKTVGNFVRLSEPAKNWLNGMLRTNTKQRTQFDAIAQDGWFNGAV